MQRVSRGCESCAHYDGFADRCAYPRRGCVKDVKPKPPPVPDFTLTACRKCGYLNRKTGDCTYPGLGCVEWQKE